MGSEAKNRGSAPPEMGAPPPKPNPGYALDTTPSGVTSLVFFFTALVTLRLATNDHSAVKTMLYSPQSRTCENHHPPTRWRQLGFRCPNVRFAQLQRNHEAVRAVSLRLLQGLSSVRSGSSRDLLRSTACALIVPGARCYPTQYLSICIASLFVVPCNSHSYFPQTIRVLSPSCPALLQYLFSASLHSFDHLFTASLFGVSSTRTCKLRTAGEQVALHEVGAIFVGDCLAQWHRSIQIGWGEIRRGDRPVEGNLHGGASPKISPFHKGPLGGGWDWSRSRVALEGSSRRISCP